MTVRIPSSLKWLINKHIRLTSEIKSLEQQVLAHEESHQQLIWDTRRAVENSATNLHCNKLHLNQLIKDLQFVDGTLRIHDIPIDPEIIAPVNSHTSVRHYKFGEMTRLIFVCLKHSAGLYRTSSEITAFIISHLDYPLSSEEKIIIRESVSKRLRRLRVQGKVIEVPQTKNTSDKHWKLSNWTALSTLGRPKILKPATTPYPDDGLDDTHATNETARF